MNRFRFYFRVSFSLPPSIKALKRRGPAWCLIRSYRELWPSWGKHAVGSMVTTTKPACDLHGKKTARAHAVRH